VSDHHKAEKHGPDAETSSAWRNWWAGKGPFLHFGAWFVALIALFSAVTFAPFLQGFFTGYLQLDARLGGIILNGLGQQTHCVGDTISSSRFAETVLSECSANEFVVFLWAGILAFPTAVRRKIVGLILGTVAVGLVNLARIVTLFLVGVYRPQIFPTVHEELWPGLFSIAMILFVAGWASWATQKGKSHAAA
jgi:exosortase family protein XrtM